MVLVITVQLVPPFIENSHRTTFPVCPDSVSVPEFVPLQTVALVAIFPPTLEGRTVIEIGTPLLTQVEVLFLTVSVAV